LFDLQKAINFKSHKLQLFIEMLTNYFVSVARN